MTNRTFGEKFRSLCLAVDPEDLLLVFFFLQPCILLRQLLAALFSAEIRSLDAKV